MGSGARCKVRQLVAISSVLYPWLHLPLAQCLCFASAPGSDSVQSLSFPTHLLCQPPSALSMALAAVADHDVVGLFPEQQDG